MTLVTKSALTLRGQSHGNSGHLLNSKHQTRVTIKTLNFCLKVLDCIFTQPERICNIGQETFVWNKSWNIALVSYFNQLLDFTVSCGGSVLTL